MGIQPLVLGDDEIRKLAGLRKYAEEHPLSLDDIIGLNRSVEMFGEAATGSVGSIPEHRLEIPFGYRVVFSIETHPCKNHDSGHRCRHLSVSIDGEFGACPSKEAVMVFMLAMGFKKKLEDGKVMIYLEAKESAHPAVNVLEEIDDPH